MNSKNTKDLQKYGPITGVALLFDNGNYYVSMEAPARHLDLMMNQIKEGVDPVKVENAEKGFVTQNGYFFRRSVARHYALRTEQIKEAKHPRLLFSDDLW